MATLVAVATMLAGCGGGVEGSPVAAERWDPCSITPEAIEAAGLDPAYRNEGWGEGVVVEDWAKCSYKPPGTEVPYFLSVESSVAYTIDEARENSANIDGRDITVAGRNAYQYRTAVGKTGKSCDIAVDLPPGVVVFSVLDMDEQPESRLCQLVIQHTSGLGASLPRADK
ncbi:hypothetical protein A2J03_24280 [Rhodococcus sp. EPR-157]|nr:hypothetical protein A2J03_24280 [Rhodococcus sp. EPR-157]